MKAAVPLLFILLVALALRLAPLDDNRFLEDEALYGYWGLQIATGLDPMLSQEPVDKPPLFPYLVALSYWVAGELETWDAAGRFTAAALETGARLPSLMASVAAVALVYRLGRVLYRSVTVGLLAAALLALSPFDISFASTAFTDPLMVALVLGALAAAAGRHPAAAGLLAGLAAATKQQGLLFLPLVVAAGLLPRRRFDRWGWARLGLGLAAVVAAVITWDLARGRQPGFFEQSLIAYGGLAPAQPAALGERAAAWLEQVLLFWGVPATAAMIGLGAGWLLVSSLRSGLPRPTRPNPVDGLLVAFAVLFLAVHWLVGFQVWDRYLLGLAPVAALLAARLVHRLLVNVTDPGRRRAAALLLGAAGVMLLAPQAGLAAASGWPAGGDHGAYDGIDELAAYMRAEAPAGAVLYHYWLGHHHRFYLHGAPLRLHWYPDPADLAADATVYRREARYIALPTFRDNAAARAALAGAGIRLVPLLETTRRDGSTSFVLYRLEGPAIGRLEQRAINRPPFHSPSGRRSIPCWS